MADVKMKTDTHPDEAALAGFLAGRASKDGRERIEEHLSSCGRCLDRVAAAYEAVAAFNKTKPHKKIKGAIMKNLNICLLLAIISFSLSFILPRYFLQLLAATLVFGIKWAADSRSTKMLISIREAYKRDRISMD